MNPLTILRMFSGVQNAVLKMFVQAALLPLGMAVIAGLIWALEFLGS